MRPLVTALVLAASSLAQAAEPSVADSIDAEAARQHQALIRDHFNITSGIPLPSGGKPFHIDLVFPEDGERTIHFWMDAGQGTATFRLTGPNHQTVAELGPSRTGELAFTRELPHGPYAVEVERAHAGGGEAVFGMKGSGLMACALDPARLTEVPASPSQGFHWPYLLFVPEKPASPHLLVLPNNTGFETVDVALLRASASCDLAQHLPLAVRLGTPVVVPLFPRPPASTSGGENLYLHALTRDALTANRPEWKRVDLQLEAMVHDARARLAARGIRADGPLLLEGFSASGSFVNRFAVLHPDDVLAVASGSPGGWPIAPVAELKREALPYPVGLAGLDQLTGHRPDTAALRKVRWFFFLGDHDDNDAVPFRDSFSKQHEELIFRLFGKTPVSRWHEAQRLYVSQGLAARFQLYEGAAHEVTPRMREDIARFFEDALAHERPTSPNLEATGKTAH